MPFILVMCDHYHTYLSVSAFSSLYRLFIVVSLSLSLSSSVDFLQIITVVFVQYGHYPSQLL